jgi:hypothetical protein
MPILMMDGVAPGEMDPALLGRNGRQLQERGNRCDELQFLREAASSLHGPSRHAISVAGGRQSFRTRFWDNRAQG